MSIKESQNRVQFLVGIAVESERLLLQNIWVLKYDSFKKDNRKNCWFRTCLLTSNFFVYETDQKLGPERSYS